MNKLGIVVITIIGTIIVLAQFGEQSGPRKAAAVGNYDPPKTYTQPALTYQSPLPYKCTTTSYDGPYKHDGRTYSTTCN